MASSLPVVLVCITLLATGLRGGHSFGLVVTPIKVPVTMKQVTCTANQKIFAVSKHNDVFTCTVPCSNGHWCPLPKNQRLKQIDADGKDVWGVDEERKIY